MAYGLLSQLEPEDGAQLGLLGLMGLGQTVGANRRRYAVGQIPEAGPGPTAWVPGAVNGLRDIRNFALLRKQQAEASQMRQMQMDEMRRREASRLGLSGALKSGDPTAMKNAWYDLNPEAGMAALNAPSKRHSLAPGAALVDDSGKPLFTNPGGEGERPLSPIAKMQADLARLPPNDPRRKQIESGLEKETRLTGVEKTPTEKENMLRDEFGNATKEYRIVKDSHTRIQQASKLGTGAGDMAIVYSYIKMLDPNTGVKEGEYATAGNMSSAVPASVRELYNKTITGTFLSKEQRSEILAGADNVYESQRSGYERQKKNYTGLAKRHLVNPENVVLDYSEPQNPVAPAPAPRDEIATEMKRRGLLK